MTAASMENTRIMLEVIVPEKKRANGCGEGEECFLVEEVLRREKVLFGKAKGCGTKGENRLRAEGWQNIADCLNS